MKNTKRIISMFLAVVMVFLMLPVTAFAEEANTQSQIDYTPFLIESLNNQAVYNEQTANMCYKFYLKARNFIDGEISNFSSIEYNGITYPVESVLYVPSDKYPTCDMLTCILNLSVGGTTKHVVLIAFRGTDFSDIQEVVTDFACATGADGYHEGFEEAAQKHYENLMIENVKYSLGNGEKISFADYIEKMSAGASNYQMIVTGHSLGAAVAGVFTSKYLDNKNNITASNAVAYTFASPLTVSDAQASKDASVVKNIFNIVNRDDFITKIGADIADGQRTGYDLKYKLNKYDSVSSNLKGLGKHFDTYRFVKQCIKTGKDFLNNHHMGTAYLPTKNYINEHINEYTNKYVLYNNYDSATNTYQRIIYNDGQLFVSGNGVLNSDWRDNTLISWAKVKDSCSNLTFSTDCTITEIGDKAFSGMEQLKNELVLPSSLTKIGNYAFFHCGFIGDLIIPSTVIEVGVNAFNGCADLDSIDASQALQMTWGYGAFANCVGEHELKLPVDNTGTDLDKIFTTYYVEDTMGIYLINAKNNTSGNVVLPNDKIYIGRLNDTEIDERPHYDFHYLLTTGHTDTSYNIKHLAQKSLTDIATVDEFGCVSIASNCAPGTEFTVIVLDNYKGNADYDVYDSGRFIHFTVVENNVNFAGGVGTAERPYLIQSYGQLNCIRNDLSAHYKLIGNIDCSGNTWSTIGNQNNTFTGTIDGNGHTISQLTGNTFITVNEGTVKNLTFNNATITRCDTFTNAVGILTAQNSGTIDYCQIVDSSVSGYYKYNSGNTWLNVGGLTTLNYGTISNSAVSNTSLSGNSRGGDNHYDVYLNMGGLTARNFDGGIIKNCTSYNNDFYGEIYHNGIIDNKSWAYFRIGGAIGFVEGGVVSATKYYNNTIDTYRDWYNHFGYNDGDKCSFLGENCTSGGVAKSNTSYECIKSASNSFNHKQVTAINLTKNPCKTHYYIGEPLNLYGLEVVNQEGVLLQGYTVSGYNNQCSGKQTLTIEYKDGNSASKITSSFDIEIENIVPTTILVQTKESTYDIQKTITLDDLVATIYYNDASSPKTVDNLSISETVKFAAISKQLDKTGQNVMQIQYYYAYMSELGEVKASDIMTTDVVIDVQCQCESLALVNEMPSTYTTYGYTGDKQCTVCHNIEDEGDIIDIVPFFNLSAANIKLGDNLTMYFYIKKEDLLGTDYSAKIVRTYSDGKADHVLTIPYSEWEDYNSTLIRVAYPGIAAKEMTDELYVTIYDGEGNIVSNTWVDSISAHAVRAYNKANNDYSRTLYADLLNYGGAAQTKFNYDVNNLASSLLTSEMLSYITPSPTLTNDQVKGTNYYATSVSFKSEVMMTMYFNNLTEDMYAEVSYTDHYGHVKSVTIQGYDFYKRSETLYGVDIAGISMGSYASLVTVNVYDASNNLVAWGVDSVGSYLLRAGANDTFYDKAAQVMVGAYKYLHRND